MIYEYEIHEHYSVILEVDDDDPDFDLDRVARNENQEWLDWEEGQVDASEPRTEWDYEGAFTDEEWAALGNNADEIGDRLEDLGWQDLDCAEIIEGPLILEEL